MTKLSPADRELFEQVFKKFEALHPPIEGEEKSADVLAFEDKLESLAELTRDSDLIQKHMLQAELQVARSRNPGIMSAVLALFLALGVEIGQRLGQPPEQMILPGKTTVN